MVGMDGKNKYTTEDIDMVLNKQLEQKYDVMANQITHLESKNSKYKYERDNYKQRVLQLEKNTIDMENKHSALAIKMEGMEFENKGQLLHKGDLESKLSLNKDTLK